MVRELSVLLLAVLLGAGCPDPWPVGEPRPVADDDDTTVDDDDTTADDDDTTAGDDDDTTAGDDDDDSTGDDDDSAGDDDDDSAGDDDDDSAGDDDDDSAGDDDDSASDGDGDGVPAGPDCDDNDPLVYPGADEVYCDSVDQDCDGSDACGSDLCSLAGSSLGTIGPDEEASYTIDVLATQMHGGEGCLDDDGGFASGGPWPFAIVSFQADEVFGEPYVLVSSDPNVQVDTNLIVLDANCDCIGWGNDIPGFGMSVPSTRSTATFVPTTTTTYLLVTALNGTTGPVLLESLDD